MIRDQVHEKIHVIVPCFIILIDIVCLLYLHILVKDYYFEIALPRTRNFFSEMKWGDPLLIASPPCLAGFLSLKAPSDSTTVESTLAGSSDVKVSKCVGTVKKKFLLFLFCII